MQVDVEILENEKKDGQGSAEEKAQVDEQAKSQSQSQVDEQAQAQAQANEQDEAQPQSKAQEQGKEESSQSEDRIRELENQMTRLSADFSNFKKRSEREKADIYKYASEDLIKAILPMIDDYDRAIDHYDEENSDAFGQGMNMIFKKLVEVLKTKGVKEIEALGADFDPNYHHAVEMSPNEHYESGKVCDVLMKGYMLNDKVIRPAMVRVAQ